MRIIDENKHVDLSEKVTVEMSLKEMALITNALGMTSQSERKGSIRNYEAEGSISKETFRELIIPEDRDNMTYQLFEMMRIYMSDRGVFNDI